MGGFLNVYTLKNTFNYVMTANSLAFFKMLVKMK